MEMNLPFPNIVNHLTFIKMNQLWINKNYKIPAAAITDQTKLPATTTCHNYQLLPPLLTYSVTPVPHNVFADGPQLPNVSLL